MHFLIVKKKTAAATKRKKERKVRLMVEYGFDMSHNVMIQGWPYMFVYIKMTGELASY